MRIKSIKTRILVSVLLIILAFGLLATYAVFTYSKNTLIANEKENIDNLNYELTKGVKYMFGNVQRLANTVAERDFLQDVLLDNEQDIDGITKSELDKYNIGGIFSAIYVMNMDGLTLASTDENFVGKNYGFRDYFQQAKAGRLGVDVVLGVTSKKLGYYFSVPVKSGDNEILGVVVFKMKPEYIHNNIEFSSGNEGSHIMMVDNFGVIVYSDDQKRLYKSLGLLTSLEKKRILDSNRFSDWNIEPMKYDIVLNEIRQKKESSLIELYDEIEKEDEIISLKKVSNFPFYLIIEEKSDLYYQEALRIAYILSIFVLLAAIFSGIVISLIIFRFLEPLMSLKESVDRISDGDYNSKLDLNENSSEEVKSLVTAFNKMITNIKKSRHDVDNKVEEQTKDLREKSSDLEKQQKAILNILEDVEEEKDKVSEEKDKISRILESIGDAVFVVNNDKIIIANQAALDISGYKSSEVLNKNYNKILKFISDDKNAKKSNILKTLAVGGVVSESQHTLFIDKKGEEVPVAVTASSLKSKNKTAKGYVVVFRDVHTEREIDKAKTEFVSLASHQLRTPLSAINWYAEMLLAGDAGKINAEQRQYLDEIYRGNQRMVALVNALLNVSRLELGTFMVEAKETDIVDIAKSVIKELQVTIKEKKLKVSLTADKKLPQLKVDPNLMRIVFQNLLSNAVKYTPAKGRVNVKIEELNQDMFIQVDDTGMGIPKKQQKKIFSKLFRADNVRETDTEGTGLGLYIVKSILDITGGKIWFASEDGKGTLFNITIPLTGMKSKKGARSLT